ncbi:MAG: hypothetical protein RL113_675 [Pseudomonadota bacterium]|jgi:energy-converting hydrogenase Eha subunit G
MRLQNPFLSFVVNFLLGIAWAMVLLGAVTSFTAFFPENLILAFLFACIGMIPGFVSVLLLEHFISAQERLTEAKKQTILLEKLLEYHTVEK